jgi:hypothetical protein
MIDSNVANWNLRIRVFLLGFASQEASRTKKIYRLHHKRVLSQFKPFYLISLALGSKSFFYKLYLKLVISC